MKKDKDTYKESGGGHCQEEGHPVRTAITYSEDHQVPYGSVRYHCIEKLPYGTQALGMPISIQLRIPFGPGGGCGVHESFKSL